ncbi:MAG: class I SAM-dependent methyltransferase [Desulfobacterales bacterium]|nr:class I SAM-dependent methyltransferase [Desulfobacterales bacterium]
MPATHPFRLIAAGLAALTIAALLWAGDAAGAASAPLDARVERFLEEKRSDWRDWNVPYEDGRVLHELILRNRHTRALEIGTSSGHSAVWIAWALSKTGGRLVTVEIDPRLHQKAAANFRAAGVEAWIDARLADAHALVPELEGPFDFIFLDADKEWYVRYFEALDPKLSPGGCFAAHNALNAYPGIREYLEHVRRRPDYRTTIDRTSSSGIAISCKRE